MQDPTCHTTQETTALSTASSTGQSYHTRYHARISAICTVTCVRLHSSAENLSRSLLLRNLHFSLAATCFLQYVFRRKPRTTPGRAEKGCCGVLDLSATSAACSFALLTAQFEHASGALKITHAHRLALSQHGLHLHPVASHAQATHTNSLEGPDSK